MLKNSENLTSQGQDLHLLQTFRNSKVQSSASQLNPGSIDAYISLSFSFYCEQIRDDV